MVPSDGRPAGAPAVHLDRHADRPRVGGPGPHERHLQRGAAGLANAGARAQLHRRAGPRGGEREHQDGKEKGPETSHPGPEATNRRP